MIEAESRGNFRLLFYLWSDKITLIQNIILRVLEAWALELLGISYIRMQIITRIAGDASIYNCVRAKYSSRTNGEAYPKTDLCPRFL